MTIQNPSGGQKYWFGGTPFEGIQKGSYDEGTQKYWFGGWAGLYLYPAAAAGNIKVIAGVAWGSVKSVSGVAKASIKKIMEVLA